MFLWFSGSVIYTAEAEDDDSVGGFSFSITGSNIKALCSILKHKYNCNEYRGMFTTNSGWILCNNIQKKISAPSR